MGDGKIVSGLTNPKDFADHGVIIFQGVVVACKLIASFSHMRIFKILGVATGV